MSEVGDKAIVSSHELVVKTHKVRQLFENELYFYQNYPELTPKLFGYNLENMSLIIEKGTPLLDDPKMKYKDELWELLTILHALGVNHRDVALSNVVIVDGVVKLIDWEAAVEHAGDPSWDLMGASKTSLLNPWPQYGEDGVWWGGPWDICPGRFKEWT